MVDGNMADDRDLARSDRSCAGRGRRGVGYRRTRWRLGSGLTRRRCPSPPTSDSARRGLRPGIRAWIAEFEDELGKGVIDPLLHFAEESEALTLIFDLGITLGITT